ncbi:MAG: putative transposase [Planctomycetota bacterium]|jgi:putative transposase
MLAETYPIQVLLMALSGLVNKHQADVIAYLVEENRVLKEQMHGRKLMLSDDQRPRLAAKAKLLGRKGLDSVTTIVTPDTLMRWHRNLIAVNWTYPAKNRVGHPGLMKKIKELILGMANDNSTWGYTRIQGEMKALGHKVARTTVANVLKENGVKPAPDRPLSWRSFLKAHWGQIAATDFLSVEVWTPKGLLTYYVLFVIDLKSRAVTIAGISTNPNEAFMGQAARNLLDISDGFLRNHRYLICDRDTKYTAKFKSAMKAARVELVLTPVMAPNCNAYAERFILSINTECLNRMIFFGEASLRRAVNEYAAHYQRERAHQGLNNERVESATTIGSGEVECVERLGGLLKHYRRAA